MLGCCETDFGKDDRGAIAGLAGKQGEGDQDAVDLGDGIFMSRNIANSYLVTSPTATS